MAFNRQRLAIIVMLVLLALTACGDKVRTVSYYVDNRDEAKEVLEECSGEYDKGYEVEGTLKENCTNARKAQMQMIRDNILQ